MQDHFKFKKVEDYTEHNYKPVGHWEDVKLNENRIINMNSSKFWIFFRIILALILLFVFFIYISYPFTQMETNILAIALIGSVCLIGIVVLMFTNVFGGLISLVIAGFAYRAIAKLLKKFFSFPDLDIGYLWIIRIMVLVIAIALIYSAIKDYKNSSEVSS